MIPIFIEMGEQGRVLLSLSACFLEAGSFPFNNPDLVGQFFDDCNQFLVGGGELGVVCHQLLENGFFVDCGGGEVVEVSLKGFHAHLVDTLICFHFVCFSNLVAAFAAPNLTEPSLARDFTRAFKCAFLYAALHSAQVLSASERSSQLSFVRRNISMESIAVDAKRKSVSSAIVRPALPACFWASSNILIYSGIPSTSRW